MPQHETFSPPAFGRAKRRRRIGRVATAVWAPNRGGVSCAKVLQVFTGSDSQPHNNDPSSRVVEGEEK